MMEVLAILAVLGIGAAILALFIGLGNLLGRPVIGKLLRVWAADRGMDVVRWRQPAPFGQGAPPIPYSFTERTLVCRATIRERKSGRLRSGWFLIPVTPQKDFQRDPDRIQVRWDDDPEPEPPGAPALPTTFAGAGLAYLVGSVCFVLGMMTVGLVLLPDKNFTLIFVFGILAIVMMGLFLLGSLLVRTSSRALHGPDGPTKPPVPSLHLWDHEFDPPHAEKY
jgi:hypothetical protein